MKKRVLSLFLSTLLILSFTACSPTEDAAQFFAMDTVMSLKVWGDDSVCEVMEQRTKTLDAQLSSVDEDSEIFKLNQTGSAVLGADAHALVERSLQLSDELRDSFDPTVYPAVLAWGFINGSYRVPDEKELQKLLPLIDSSAVRLDGDTVTLPDGMMLDLGAVAKGYLADALRDTLADSSAIGAVLNLGGTILLYGEKPDHTPFKVGIADPDDPAGYFGYLRCREGVAATSGGYERYFEKDGKRYIHILDPTTAQPVDNGTLSVTIFSGDGILSDALSTALFVMGIDKATAYYREHNDFDFIILTDDNTLYITEGIFDDFTLADGFSFELQKITR